MSTGEEYLGHLVLLKCLLDLYEKEHKFAMKSRLTLCLCALVVVAAPPVRGQAAAEFRDRLHDAQTWPKQAVRASHGPANGNRLGAADPRHHGPAVGY